MPRQELALVLSLALGGAVWLIAGLLAWWQARDRARREGEDLSEADALHFDRQDARRSRVTILMALLGLGLIVGTRLEPRVAGKANPLFLATWLAVFAGVVLLLMFALHDWAATRVYALRHRDAIHRQRMALLEAELKRIQDRHASGT